MRLEILFDLLPSIYESTRPLFPHRSAGVVCNDGTSSALGALLGNAQRTGYSIMGCDGILSVSARSVHLS
jgi:hypothetical protein